MFEMLMTLESAFSVRLLVLDQAIVSSTVILPPLGVGTALVLVAVVTTTLPVVSAPMIVDEDTVDIPPLSVAS